MLWSVVIITRATQLSHRTRQSRIRLWSIYRLVSTQHSHVYNNTFSVLVLADGQTLGLTAYWLGGNDLHREGSWVWPSGQPFTYTNWVEGEPNDQDGKEDCIAIDSPKEYKWMDLNCTEPMHGAVTHFTVCERIPGGF